MHGQATTTGPSFGKEEGTEAMSDKITRWAVGVFGDSSRSGRWRAVQRLGAVAVFGDSTLDLREAVIDGDEIEISAEAIFGEVNIIVAPDSRVELSGVALFGDKRSQLTEAASPSGPLVQVKAVAIVGDVNVR